MNDPTLPYIEQYFGRWCIESSAASALQRFAASIDLAAHMAARTSIPNPSRAKYVPQMTEDGIAIVHLEGVMMKQESSLTESISTAMMRRTLRAIAVDAAAQGALLVFDSPGGTFSGLPEFADDIAFLASMKPTHAFAQGMMASAAYWAASQASRITARPEAEVGSIGVYCVIEDSSAAAAMQGVKVHVVSSGGFKGMGVEGTAITEQALGELQRQINETTGFFHRAVKAARNLSDEQMKAATDGRVWFADQAASMGLVDEVGNLDTALTALRTAITSAAASAARSPKSGESPKETQMSQTQTPAPAPAGQQQVTETGAAFIECFGDVGARAFAEGKTFYEAAKLHNEAVAKAHREAIAAQETALQESRAKVEDLEQKLAAAKQIGTPAVSGNMPAEGGKPAPTAKQAENLSDGMARFAAGLKLPANTK